ncbi:MAG: hypothetical protein Q8P20_08355 [bacterium]|nr:hypothetical protein [bacterium]
MDDQVVLYLGGGGMSGVFGGGVAAGLERMDIYDKIKAVYSCSAGTFNGAYFLTKQCEFGASIYWDELAHGFIRRRNMPYGAIQRLWNAYMSPIKHQSIKNVMYADKLLDVVKYKKKFDVEKLKNQPIPLYAKMVNTETMEVEYIDIRKGDTLHLLKSGISAIPYYYPSPNNGKYVDGAIKEPLGLEYILEQNPGSKVIAIFNLSVHRHFGHYIKNFIEGAVANTMYPGVFSKCFMVREGSVRKCLKAVENNDQVLLIHPSKDNLVQSWILDESKLKNLHAEGLRAAEKIKEFIG